MNLAIRFHSLHTIAPLNHEIVEMDPKLMRRKYGIHLLSFSKNISNEMRKQEHVNEVKYGDGKQKLKYGM